MENKNKSSKIENALYFGEISFLNIIRSVSKGASKIVQESKHAYYHLMNFPHSKYESLSWDPDDSLGKRELYFIDHR